MSDLEKRYDELDEVLQALRYEGPDRAEALLVEKLSWLSLDIY